MEYDFFTPSNSKKLTVLHFIKSKWILVNDNFSLIKATDKLITKTIDTKSNIGKIATVSGPTDCNVASIYS